MSAKECNEKNVLDICVEIQYGSKGIQSVSFHPSQHGFHWRFLTENPNQMIEDSVNKWLREYSCKRHSSVQLLLDWTKITPFTQQVLEVVASIPFGSILTYGEVADLLGRPEAARAVGGACGRNPFLLFIPCHRVLDAKFELRGFSAGGISVKKKLLQFEDSFPK